MSGDHVYAAQLKKTRKGHAVRGLVYKQTTWDTDEADDREKKIISELREIANNQCFKGKKTVLHLPSKNISSFPILIEAKKTESIEEAIVRESKEYISFPLEEAVIDYPSLIPLPTGDSVKYKAIILAIHRDPIQEYLRILKRAGLIVDVIDFDVSSLIRLHQFGNQISQNPIILCHIDHHQCLISAVTSSGILAIHHSAWGFNYLLEKVRTNLELAHNDTKTEQLLKQYGLAYSRQEDNGVNRTGMAGDGMQQAIYQIIMPYIEELIDEFHKMTVYLRSEERDAFVEEIYLYGWANSVHDLDYYFEKRLNIPTRLVNPLTDFALDQEGFLPDSLNGAPFALAIGLALRRVAWL
jgi:type IV pilus assembly protein PilM